MNTRKKDWKTTLTPEQFLVMREGASGAPSRITRNCSGVSVVFQSFFRVFIKIYQIIRAKNYSRKIGTSSASSCSGKPEGLSLRSIKVIFFPYVGFSKIRVRSE